MSCKHEFEGTADGVRCNICGLFMSADEFINFITKPPKTEPTQPQTRRKGGVK